MRLSIEEVDRRRPDLDGEGSRELGLLCGCRPTESNGDSDRGVDGARGSRLVVVEAGDRDLGWVYGSDLLRMREPR